MFVKDKDGDYQFYPITDDDVRHDRLPAGAYIVGMTAKGPYFKPVTVTDDDLVDLGSGIAHEIDAEIESFFDPATRKRLAEARVKNRRGMLLYGPPGTGKTSLFRGKFGRLIADDTIILIEPPIRYFQGPILDAIYFGEPAHTRNIALFFDEFDRVADDYEEDLKRILDGLTSPSNLIVFACTNHLDRIPEALSKRPSRFSLVRSMPAIGPRLRRVFVDRKFSFLDDSVRAELVEGLGDRPLDYLQEAVTLHLRGLELPDIWERLNHIEPDLLDIDD